MTNAESGLTPEQLGSELDTIRRIAERIDNRLDGVERRLDGVDQRLDVVDQRFDGVDQRFDRIEQHISDELNQFDRRLSRIESRNTAAEAIQRFPSGPRTEVNRVASGDTITEPYERYRIKGVFYR